MNYVITGLDPLHVLPFKLKERHMVHVYDWTMGFNDNDYVTRAHLSLQSDFPYVNLSIILVGYYRQEKWR